MVTIVENNTQGEMITISISVPPTMINQVGELVTQLSAFALSINGSVGAKNKTAPMPAAKKPTKAEEKERRRKRLLGIKE